VEKGRHCHRFGTAPYESSTAAALQNQRRRVSATTPHPSISNSIVNAE
jgi:hypothetical protein